MTMRRVSFWWFVFAVLVVFVGAEVFVRAVDDRLPPPPKWPSAEFSHKEDRIGELARAGGASVVIVGSSVVDISVDAAALATASSRPAYNASLIGVGPAIVDAWTRLLVEPKLNPDVVVIGLSSRDLNRNGGLESAAVAFTRTPGAKHLLGTESTADRLKRRAAEVSALVRYRQVLRRPLQALARYKPPNETDIRNTPSGLETHLLGTQFRDTPTVRAYFRNNPLRGYALSDVALRSVERLASTLKARGVRVVLLDVPVLPLYVELHPTPADYATYQAAVDALAARVGVEVLHAGIWPDGSLFSDPLHLNGRGMRQLTRVVDGHLGNGGDRAGAPGR